MVERATELDPQAAALIDELESGVSPPSSTLSVATGRALLEELFAVDDPEPVGSVTDLEIQGPNGPIPVRIYEPEGEGPFPLLTFFHGGGWVRGSVDAYDGLCRLLTNSAGCLVVSVDYRRAPEHPFPAGFEDCYAAAAWAADNAADLGADPERVAVGGDSAGGNLTAAVTLAAKDRDGPEFAHQLLVYPALTTPNLDWFDSYDENGEGYFLELESMEWYYDQYLPDDAHEGNIYACPLRAPDLSGLPPATVVTAGYDLLRDEGAAYADRLATAGVDVDHRHYDAQIHGFMSLYEELDAGREAIEDVARRLADAF